MRLTKFKTKVGDVTFGPFKMGVPLFFKTNKVLYHIS